MGKKLVIPLVFVILIISIVLVSAVECTDTDGGINFYEKGIATMFPESDDDVTDYCESEVQLREYSCKVSREGRKSTVYMCPEGCEDGACKGEEIPLGENECFDTDQYLNLYEKGQLIDKPHNADYFDSCLSAQSVEEARQGLGEIVTNGTILKEFYCGDTGYQYEYYNCHNGCINGACAEVSWNTSIKGITCTDSDAKYPVMVNFFEKGFVNNTNGLYTPGFYEDDCEGDTVIEYTCDLSGAIEVRYDCLYGCENGACIEFEIISPKKNENPIKITEEIGENLYFCDGCEKINKCYPLRYRKNSKFCFYENNQFTKQKKGEVLCDDNFECSSNECISGVCSEPSFFKKIADWFNNLFG